MRIGSLGVLAVLVFSGCGDDKLDVGDGTARVGAALEDYAATWDGYAEAHTFMGDGSDRIRLSIDESGNGVVRFGDEALFAPATDPVGLYPPTYAYEFPDAWPRSTGSEPRSGYEYAFTAAGVTNARLKLSFDSAQLMESWCQLEPPVDEPMCGTTQGIVQTSPAGQPCLWAEDFTNFVELSCNRFTQCFYCACEGSDCHSTSGIEVMFDGSLTDGGDRLTGTLLLGDERINVVMTRQP